jgi:hypothetical protein
MTALSGVGAAFSAGAFCARVLAVNRTAVAKTVIAKTVIAKTVIAFIKMRFCRIAISRFNAACLQLCNDHRPPDEDCKAGMRRLRSVRQNVKQVTRANACRRYP